MATIATFGLKEPKSMRKRAKRSPQPSRRPVPVKKRRSAGTAMIADDQRLVGEAIAGLIGAEQSLMIVHVTSDAIDLLEVAKRDPPALAVIDAAMAQSFWVARSLAIHCPPTKVILIDDLCQDVHLQRARDCGAAGYLTKCDTRADFAAALAQIMAGRQAFSNQIVGHQVSGTSVYVPTSASGADPTPALLTPREHDVLALLAEGLRVSDCARVLGISPNTVDNHKARIMRKLGMHKTVELTRFAIRHGIVSDS
jgi:NarL family two-component system response regulator LiaR